MNPIELLCRPSSKGCGRGWAAAWRGCWVSAPGRLARPICKAQQVHQQVHPTASPRLWLHPTPHATGGVLYGTHGPALLFKASGLAILGSSACAAAVLAAARWRRKRRRGLLPSSESLDSLPSMAH